MKLRVVILGLVMGLTSCNEAKKINLAIPDKVKIKKEGKHQQLPGTKIFIVGPENYELIGSLIRFQKDDSTFIQAVETPVNFTEQKAKGIQAFEEAKGLSSSYQKEFKLGDYDAFLIYGPDNKRPGCDQILLLFGDKEFGAMIVGEIPRNNEKTRQEVLAALLTAYVDKSATADYSALQNFTVDVSKSEFRFFRNASQTFLYTIDGKGDFNIPFQDEIMIMTLPPMDNFDARKAYAQSMIQRYKNDGISIPDFEEKEIKINSESAYEITFTGEFQGKSVKVYQVVTGDNKATILFCGLAYTRQEELFEQFKDVAQTLRTK